jgi:predicted RNase H-like HicB family nuclease
MAKYDQLLARILRGGSDANIPFNDLCWLLQQLGFEERIRGSHHIFRKVGVEEKINLQRDDGKAKGVSSLAGAWDHPEVPSRRAGSMMNYEIILYWSEEDGVFVAEVPELPGCMAHGDTQEAALASAKQAMQLWIDTAREFGDAIPPPKGRRLMFA